MSSNDACESDGKLRGLLNEPLVTFLTLRVQLSVAVFLVDDGAEAIRHLL